MAHRMRVVDDETIAEMERRGLVRPADWRGAIEAGYARHAQGSGIGRRSVWIGQDSGEPPESAEPRTAEPRTAAPCTAAPCTAEPPRSGHFSMPGAVGSLKVFGAGWPGGVMGLAGYAAGFGRAGVEAAVVLFSSETGTVRALVTGATMPVRKTAAVAAVAATHLARPGPDRVLGIVGAGTVAASCAEQLCHAIRPALVRAYRRDGRALAAFCDRVAAATGVPCVAADSVAAAVEDAHVVLTATTSPSPVLHSRWIRPGAVVLGMGTHYPSVRELSDGVIARGRIVVDSRQHSLEEKGDLLIPIEAGLVDAEHIVGELGEVIAGDLAPRTNPDDIVVFTSVGLALEYVAVATMVAEVAEAHGLGGLANVADGDRPRGALVAREGDG